MICVRPHFVQSMSVNWRFNKESVNPIREESDQKWEICVEKPGLFKNSKRMGRLFGIGERFLCSRKTRNYITCIV